MDKDLTVKRLRSYDELLADERYYKQQFQASEARVAELEKELEKFIANIKYGDQVIIDCNVVTASRLLTKDQ